MSNQLSQFENENVIPVPRSATEEFLARFRAKNTTKATAGSLLALSVAGCGGGGSSSGTSSTQSTS